MDGKGIRLLKDLSEFNGDSTGISAKFNVKGGDVIRMKIAISYTSIDNARNNLHHRMHILGFRCRPQ